MNKSTLVDLVTNVTTVISHPLDVVWPHLLDQATWMNEFRIETIEGERNAVGEVKKIMSLNGQPEIVPFFFRTMLLIPLRRFVYKAYTEIREGKYGFTGVEVLSLNDFGRDSAITFEAYLEVQSWTMTQQELSAFVNVGRDSSIAMWKRNFERLASVVGGASGV